MFNSMPLTGYAASIAAALGVQPPQQAGRALAPVEALVKARTDTGKVDRVLCYNPDCIGFWLYQKYTECFIPVMTRTQMTLPMQAVFPPVTPVCFGTMYTGATPAVHGIRKYEKSVITLDSLFDALARQGKKVALVVWQDSSMEKIFRNRPIDYVVCGSDAEVEEKALALIEADEYDMIVVYHQDYDDAIHDTTPESERSMAALQRHINSFARLSDATERCWKGHDTLLSFAPDHGLHLTVEGVGNHFADIPEDMNMIHFWAVQPKD